MIALSRASANAGLRLRYRRRFVLVCRCERGSGRDEQPGGPNLSRLHPLSPWSRCYGEMEIQWIRGEGAEGSKPSENIARALRPPMSTSWSLKCGGTRVGT
jgi:hypothetical protein